MRTRKRIHPYVAPDLAKRLAAYCATRGVTESAAVESAIENHLSGVEKDNDVILRRLGRLGRASARHQRDLEVLSEAFAVFVRYWAAYLPERSRAEQDAAQHLAARRYEYFVDLVSAALARSSRFSSKVLKEESIQRPSDSGSKAERPPEGSGR